MKEAPKTFQLSVRRTEEEFVEAIKNTSFPLKLLHILLFIVYALAHYFLFFVVAVALFAIVVGPVVILFFYLRLSLFISLIIGIPIGLFVAYLLVTLLPRLRFFGDDGRFGN